MQSITRHTHNNVCRTGHSPFSTYRPVVICGVKFAAVLRLPHPSHLHTKVNQCFARDEYPTFFSRSLTYTNRLNKYIMCLDKCIERHYLLIVSHRSIGPILTIESKKKFRFILFDLAGDCFIEFGSVNEMVRRRISSIHRVANFVQNVMLCMKYIQYPCIVVPYYIRTIFFSCVSNIGHFSRPMSAPQSPPTGRPNLTMATWI